MSLLKFLIYWEEDSAICRQVEILSNQTFFDLHVCIKTAFQLPETMEASLYVSNNHWLLEKEISSIVEKNLRDAPALSMKRTPIGALINDPHQRFVYVSNHLKKWTFHLEIITLFSMPEETDMYPRCVMSEGLSPSQIGVQALEKDSVLEIEER